MVDDTRSRTLARRIACRLMDIDPEQPSEWVDTAFTPGNVRGEFAVEEARRALATAEQQGKEAGQAWVDCKERMPGTCDGVMFTNGTRVIQGYWDGHAEKGDFAWHALGGSFRMLNEVVSHWMPLPEPPSKPEGGP